MHAASAPLATSTLTGTSEPERTSSNAATTWSIRSSGAQGSTAAAVGEGDMLGSTAAGVSRTYGRFNVADGEGGTHSFWAASAFAAGPSSSPPPSALTPSTTSSTSTSTAPATIARRFQ